MKQSVSRVAAVHDLSGFGRSSLNVVIPILSTMELQVCSLPTSVLSAHTDFEEYYFVDMTEHMEKILAHWRQLNISFDCIYSGFLGSPRQVEIISRFIDQHEPSHPLVVIDPVMADNGRLYDTMSNEMVINMQRYISKADIITPNLTEAAFLLGEKYDPLIGEKEIKQWMLRLAQMGPSIVIITSVPATRESKNTSVLAYNREDGRFWKVSCVYIPAHFPGTGDAFTSVVTGSILQGDSLPIALDRGVQFITAAIRASYGYKYPEREGVLLERVLGNLKLPVLASTYEILE